MAATSDLTGNWSWTVWLLIPAVLLLAYVPAERLVWWLSPLIAAHVLIGLLIGRSFVEHAFLVARYALARR